jgi:hypothetical protein
VSFLASEKVKSLVGLYEPGPGLLNFAFPDAEVPKNDASLRLSKVPKAAPLCFSCSACHLRNNKERLIVKEKNNEIEKERKDRERMR